MEITYADFLGAKHNKEACENFKTVASDKKNPFNKIATQKHISAKRFKKLMMAVGFDRDESQHRADRVGAFWGCYQTYFDDAKDELLWRIQNRTFEESLAAALGPATKHPHKRWMATKSAYVYDVIPKIRKKNEKEYQELLAIAEKYPDVVDEVECKKLKDCLVIEISTLSGKDKVRYKELKTQISELSKLHDYLEFRPYT